ncbi:hypothetical protein GUITHDRAFT_105315 [Guillardia theta CCMP2712]|uniref:Ribosomal protein eL8/eL30/eS12/Gadd45 domain-containing protein n=1 Tax=Guillardia theta (strain CCMP2712) TaxID=905079 RepID=L1JK18_GUITC|nr:hypothetical protein GUITHDRAFT_105315 [Guillardia theta CCMP2712]EKX48682.1 hypothetical protein GUITHDRAFT_105315 [Guillardia theta CCMP2712]|eukprot:XP_005835662.1 hypothetical protein GUITHDRAFT_105315 [Guillardia theta CCMP2712]
MFKEDPRFGEPMPRNIDMLEEQQELLELRDNICCPLAVGEILNDLLCTIEDCSTYPIFKRGARVVMGLMGSKQLDLVVAAKDVGEKGAKTILNELPKQCKTHNVPLVWVEKSEDIAKACGSKKPVACIGLVGSEGTQFLGAIRSIVSRVFNGETTLREFTSTVKRLNPAKQ